MSKESKQTVEEVKGGTWSKEQTKNFFDAIAKMPMPKKLPNGIDLRIIYELLMYSDRYEISVQFWPEQIAVFIAKDGVELTDYGGSGMFSVKKAIEYLNRITGNNKTKQP